MNTLQKWLGPVLFCTCLGGGLTLGWSATTDLNKKRSSEVAVLQNALYDQECGSCHFAYQPGWLPARSWDKIMTGLKDHFGENATLAAEPQRQLTDWLRVHAADHAQGGKIQKMVRSIPAQATPIRITEIPYFQKEHRKLPLRTWKENPQVRSLSHCATCHPQAKEGSFDEHAVRIPNFGPWKD
ncbi:MAG: hypothetical protein G8237_12500 [Magnetococcales bacterium]|nr:diheme cytochrome c [Magnetococcales bacterium]NGZ07163.1 hypothetical protein [Magnetococcales bacterium]